MVVRGEGRNEEGDRIFEGNALLANRQGVARIFEVGHLFDSRLNRAAIIVGENAPYGILRMDVATIIRRNVREWCGNRFGKWTVSSKLKARYGGNT